LNHFTGKAGYNWKDRMKKYICKYEEGLFNGAGLILLIFFILLASSLTVIAKDPVTVYLAGDSTCAIKQPDKRPETGWGEMLPQYFDSKKVKIDNRALNGRSTKSFIAEGEWKKIIDALKPGDYVFIQFGHNDESKDKGERYSTPEEFKKNLVKFITEVRAKKGFPVLMTPVMRRRFNEKGEFYDTHGEYPDLTRAVAAEYKVPLIDMHRKSEAVIKRYGEEGSKKLFMILKEGESPNYPKGLDDNTHFQPLGAEEMAKCAAEGIRETKLKLRKFLKK
jgi:pectinesterase